MKQRHNRQRKSASSWKAPVIAAGILAVMQVCLTVEGMGIEGSVLWVIILFVGYWLLFMTIRWLWRRYGKSFGF
jgi:hypothetical protein